MAHSEAPWTKNKRKFIVDSTGLLVATTSGSNDNEMESNAHLISAAPEMLEMLEKLLPKLSQLQDESAFTLPEKVETLISKAKGL